MFFPCRERTMEEAHKGRGDVRMSTNTCLADSVKRTHDGLVDGLAQARRVPMETAKVRRGSPSIDGLLAHASAHMHAVDEVLVPAARLAHATEAVRDYRRASRNLGVALAHTKAHEFGSTIEARVSWSDVWDELEQALAAERQSEEAMVAEMEAAELGSFQALTERLERAEKTAPSRPHPYLPHRGPMGHLTRRVMRRMDRWWDNAEGRYVPEPVHPHKALGLVGQYFTGTPHMQDESKSQLEE